MRGRTRRGSERRRRAGLTLIEAGILVCVVGIVLAVFVPTFVRELRTSKVSEAASELGRMHDATAAYYAARHGHRGSMTRCLPPAAGPTPATGSTTPVEVDFLAAPAANTDDDAADATDPPADGSTTWRALAFTPQRPIRFRYTFISAAAGCDLEGQHLVTFRAEGDLDGDGKHSIFERMAGQNAQGDLAPIGILHAADSME
jgi:type II secretory pathway pseudopilin PulG